MLNWINRRKHNIAGGSLAAFAGGWLLFLCQVCMAQPSADQSDLHHMDLSGKPAPEIPCHDTTGDNSPQPGAHDSNQVENHCVGMCDCDSVDVSLNNSEQQAKTDKPSPGTDVAAILEQHAGHSSKPAVAHFIPRQPDRAVLLPYQRFIVLLI